MRKIITMSVLMLMLCAMTLSGCSCNGTSIDWKQIAQKAITFGITELLLPAYEKFHGDKTSIVDAVVKQIEASEALAPYVKYVDVKMLVGQIFDVVDKQWYSVLHKKGADTDAEETLTPMVYEYSISALDFPDIFDIEIN